MTSAIFQPRSPGEFYLIFNSWWGHLDTLRIWLHALKWKRRSEGRWEFAFHVFRVSLNYIRVPHLKGKGVNSSWILKMSVLNQFIRNQESFCCQGCKTECSIAGDRLCFSWDGRVHWELRESLIWLDRNFTFDIKSSWGIWEIYLKGWYLLKTFLIS